MIFRFWFLPLLLLVFSASPGHGEPVCGFDCVLASALSRHPAVLGKRSEQAAALAAREGAKWSRYPSPTIELSSGSDESTSGVFRVDQPLWAGGGIDADIKAASSRFDAAGRAVEETQLDMALRVINAYTEALRQKARQQYAEVSVKEHQKLLDMIRRRVDQNVSSRTDQRLAESRLLQVENESVLAAQALANMLTNLEQLSGVKVSDVSWPTTNDQSLPASLQTVQDLAIRISPRLGRLNSEEVASAADIKSRKSVYWPKLVARFEHRAGNGFEDDSRGLIVLQAQPGAGLSAASGVSEAVARREAIRLARDAAEREIRERVAFDWNEWTAARLRFAAAENSSQISSEVFESYTRQYVIGRKSWIDVMNAVREAMNANFSLADTRSQIVAASLRLQAQTGTLKMNGEANESIGLRTN